MEALVPERERQRTTRARSRSDTPTKVVEVMVTLRGPFVAARGATLRYPRGLTCQAARVMRCPQARFSS